MWPGIAATARTYGNSSKTMPLRTNCWVAQQGTTTSLPCGNNGTALRLSPHKFGRSLANIGPLPVDVGRSRAACVRIGPRLARHPTNLRRRRPDSYTIGRKRTDVNGIWAQFDRIGPILTEIGQLGQQLDHDRHNSTKLVRCRARRRPNLGGTVQTWAGLVRGRPDSPPCRPEVARTST